MAIIFFNLSLLSEHDWKDKKPYFTVSHLEATRGHGKILEKLEWTFLSILPLKIVKSYTSPS